MKKSKKTGRKARVARNGHGNGKVMALHHGLRVFRPSKHGGYGWTRDLPDARDVIYSAPLLRFPQGLPPSVDLRSECPPIYDQGQTNYNVAVAASQLDQAKAGLQQTKLTVEADVRTALANLISARANLVQAISARDSAQVSLDATQAQYKVGAATILNLVTAEANLSTATATYISGLYGVRTAEQNYLYATGASDLQL